MDKPQYKSALIKRLVPVRDAHGTIVDYQWALVEGQELDLSSQPPLADGDTLVISGFVVEN